MSQNQKRLPRKLKKVIKNATIIYDYNSLPKGLLLEDIVRAFKNTGFIFYSSESGEKPISSNKKVKLTTILNNFKRP